MSYKMFVGILFFLVTSLCLSNGGDTDSSPSGASYAKADTLSVSHDGGNPSWAWATLYHKVVYNEPLPAPDAASYGFYGSLTHDGNFITNYYQNGVLVHGASVSSTQELSGSDGAVYTNHYSKGYCSTSLSNTIISLFASEYETDTNISD